MLKNEETISHHTDYSSFFRPFTTILRGINHSAQSLDDIVQNPRAIGTIYGTLFSQVVHPSVHPSLYYAIYFYKG